MEIENIFTYSITILSLIALIVSWIVKIRWSKVFKEAKQAEIKVLEQHIKTLNDLTPDRIKKFYVSMKEMFLSNIDELDKTIETMKKRILELEDEVKEVKGESVKSKKMEEALFETSIELGKMVNKLELKEDELRKLKTAFKNIDKKRSLNEWIKEFEEFEKIGKKEKTDDIYTLFVNSFYHQNKDKN